MENVECIRIGYWGVPGLSNEELINLRIPKTTLEKLIHIVCDEYGISPSLLMVKRRLRYLSEPRYMICYFARFVIPTGLRLEEVGQKICYHYHHCNVIAGSKRIQILLDANDKDITKKYNNIFKQSKQINHGQN